MDFQACSTCRFFPGDDKGGCNYEDGNPRWSLDFHGDYVLCDSYKKKENTDA